MTHEIPEIRDVQYDLIASGLATNIARWYREGKIEIEGFYGRGNELQELIEKIDTGDRVLVCGVGGIGKTALIQVALLLQAMLGKKIISVGPKQSYLSGTGLSYFRSKTAVECYETQQPETITLYDLAVAFKVPEDVQKAEKKDLIHYLVERLRAGDRLTFIDDFHLADQDVKDLVQQVPGGIILAGKEDAPFAQQQMQLQGVESAKRVEMARGMASRLGKKVDEDSIRKIAELSEGHPVVAEIMVRNYQIVNYDDIRSALQSEKATGDEFLRRVVTSVLTPGALETLQQLALINPDLETNLADHAIRRTFESKDLEELIQKNFLVKRGQGNCYLFTFQSIRQTIAVGREDEKGLNEAAIGYYRNKTGQDGRTSPDDQAEILYHQVRGTKDPALVERIGELYEKVNPQDYGFRRLAVVCEELALHLDEENRVLIFGIAGTLYNRLRIYDKAEEFYLAALEILEKLANRDLGVYTNVLVMIQINLGNLYSETGQHEEAERSYLVALEICEQLAAQNPDTYNGDLAMTKNNLGTLYKNTGRHAEAERYYLAALKIREQLATLNPDAYSKDLAGTQNNLGVLYKNTGRHAEAERSYLAALKIYEKLAAKNPDAYNGELAKMQNNLGTLYKNTSRYTEAERSYLGALEICEELVANNPDAYGADLAMTQNNLGNLYNDTGLHTEAEKYFLEALEIRRKLAARNLDAYGADLAKIQNNLGTLYCDTSRYTEAESS